MTREELVQCPDYWKALYEDECERLNIQPCLVFSKQEPINEEKLDKLAESYDIPIYGDGCAYSDDEWDEIQDWVENAYKAGYRKAKEGQL